MIMQTMSPMIINSNENFTLDFNKYLVHPKEFSFEVKNSTQPINGHVIKKVKMFMFTFLMKHKYILVNSHLLLD